MKVFTNGRINFGGLFQGLVCYVVFFLTRKERVGASEIMLLYFHPAKDPGFF